MKFSDAYGRYEGILRQLHALNAVDALDSPEADDLREKMDVEWKELSGSERALLRGLSADLYSLTNEEIIPANVFLNETALMQAAQREYDAHDWLSLLNSLRALSDRFPKRSAVAYMRGCCWRELGRPEPALWFFELAHQLQPSDPNYELLALDAMFRSSRRPEAIAKASALLDSAEVRPHVVFGAAKVVSEVAPLLAEVEAKDLYTRVSAALQSALDHVVHGRTTKLASSLVLAARLNLAIAYERLGENEKALDEYDKAVAEFPGRDEIIIARAMFFLGTDPERGRRDLSDLVQRNTLSVYPYFFLAHDALIEERFERCIELCDRVLQNATQSMMRAHALEWTAISTYELGGSIEAAKELFREAAYLAPLNENILRNLEVAEKLAEQPRDPLSSFNLSQPVRPDDVTADIRARLAIALG